MARRMNLRAIATTDDMDGAPNPGDVPTVSLDGKRLEYAPGASGIVESVVAGTNVTVDSTDPANPIVSATGGASGAQGPPLYPTAAYPPSLSLTSTVTVSSVVGNLALYPLLGVGRIGALDMSTSSASSGVVRVGLYSPTSSTDPTPGALLYSAGTLSASGATGLRTLTFSPVTVSGLVWLAVLGETAGAGWNALQASTVRTPILGSTPAATFTYYTGLTATGVATGSLPSTAPALTLSTANVFLLRGIAA